MNLSGTETALLGNEEHEEGENGVISPRLERVLERSMMVCLLGLLRTERLAREMSAVTRVMDILERRRGASFVSGVPFDLKKNKALFSVFVLTFPQTCV